MPFGLGLGLGCGDGGTWLPTTEPGCPLWLRSDMGVTTTTGIARWLDRSGQFNHVAQDTAANKPALSGKALAFDGVNTFLHRAVVALNGDYTIGIALTPAATTGIAITSGGAADGVDLNFTGNARTTAHRNVAAVAWGAGAAAAERWVARYDFAGTAADMALDGAHQAPQGLANQIAATGSTAIGADHNGATPLTGDICAVYFYDSRLSDADTVALDARLAALQAGTTPPALPGAPILSLERPDLYAGSHVSAWANQGTAGAARDISQAVASKRMVLLPGGGPNGGLALHADGVDDYLRGTWTQAQPTHLFAMALPTQTGVVNASLIDGGVNISRLIYSPNGTDIAMFAGGPVVAAADPTQWHRIETLWDGVSCKLRVDDIAPSSGNAGAAAADGLTVGIRGNKVSNPADGLITEIFEYDRNDLSAEAIARAHAYMTGRYGI